MSNIHVQIKPLNLKAASMAEYELLSLHSNIIRAERFPDDPPTPLEEHIKGWQNRPNFSEMFSWLAFEPEGNELVGSCGMVVNKTGENAHLAHCWLEVLPQWRQRGIGRQLWLPILEVARREGRRLIGASTYDRVPAGAAFMERVGAKRGLEAHVNQLRIPDLDRGLLRRWQEQACERAAGFEVGFWIGSIPESELEAAARLLDVGNTVPRGELDYEDHHTKPEHIRAWEQELAATGTERWAVYARDQATGTYAGYTEIFWNPNRPTIADQGLTGVFPEYRNKGLGRWIKAAMLERLLAEHPEIELVRTGNADVNAPMLGINHALGFKPYSAEYYWQVETEQVAQYLEAHGIATDVLTNV